MTPTSRTPEGQPIHCPVCGHLVVIEPSTPTREAACPSCGFLLWFPQIVGRDDPFGFHKLLISDHSIGTKRQAIVAIVDRLVGCGSLPNEHRQGVLAALLNREELGSTGIGRGIAIPHAKCPNLDKMVGAIAKFATGIDFDSLDGQPVHFVCLLISPADQPGDHLRVLQGVSRSLRDSNYEALFD